MPIINMVESHELLRKTGLFFIIVGFIIAAIGAAATFLWSAGMVAMFYLGFFVAIIGFALAVLSKI